MLVDGFLIGIDFAVQHLVERDLAYADPPLATLFHCPRARKEGAMTQHEAPLDRC